MGFVCGVTGRRVRLCGQVSIGMMSSVQRSNSGLPATLDASRMLAERRVFEGALPLAGMSRLVADLADDSGQACYRLEFGVDETGGGMLHVEVTAALALQCQRTLETFDFLAEVDTRLGLVDNERQQDGLPQGVEPLLLDEGMLRPADVIEDELLLALPLVPMKPGSQLPEHASADAFAGKAGTEDNPFAVLGKLKQDK